ncbi:hypothetical protein MBLNU230_g8554t1 [Neophaeotheca triangularis]
MAEENNQATYTCGVCLGDYPGEAPFEVPGAGAALCAGCIPTSIQPLFEAAIENEMAWPPKWGTHTMEIETFEQYFPPEMVERYKAVHQERLARVPKELSPIPDLTRGVDYQDCPRCFMRFFRFTGCNHMTCSAHSCRAHFCYLCGIEADHPGSGHYTADGAAEGTCRLYEPVHEQEADRLQAFSFDVERIRHMIVLWRELIDIDEIDPTLDVRGHSLYARIWDYWREVDFEGHHWPEFGGPPWLQHYREFESELRPSGIAANDRFLWGFHDYVSNREAVLADRQRLQMCERMLRLLTRANTIGNNETWRHEASRIIACFSHNWLGLSDFISYGDPQWTRMHRALKPHAAFVEVALKLMSVEVKKEQAGMEMRGRLWYINRMVDLDERARSLQDALDTQYKSNERGLSVWERFISGKTLEELVLAEDARRLRRERVAAWGDDNGGPERRPPLAAGEGRVVGEAAGQAGPVDPAQQQADQEREDDERMRMG